MNKKVIKRRLNFLKQPVQNFVSKGNHRRVNQYARFYEKLKVEKNTILYESRDGNSMTDSPYAMFKHMLDHPEFEQYIHIWSIQNPESMSKYVEIFNEHPHVRFVKRNSKEYLRALATSEYLINNSTFQSFFIPKPDQVYINTWHGTPLKSMGFDIPGNPSHSQNVVRNFLSTKYLLSPNAHTTKMFTDSYKLKGLYEGSIIEEGYPRIDLTFHTDRVQYLNDLMKLGLRINKQKDNILYAPTWKGTSVSKANDDIPQIIADCDYLEEQIGDQYNLLIKVHPFLYKEALKYSELNGRLIPDDLDTNELLAAMDIMVTDYSSIFFDYLVTNKPILFYTWDADVYNEERGQYLKMEELPGPSIFNARELAEAIKNIKNISREYQDRYEKIKQKFTKHDDGKVTERIVNHIFLKSPEKLNVITDLNTGKKKILIYPGGMKNNGITSSFINLMNNIDYEKFDVSCFTATPKSQEVLNNIAKISPNVRFLFKPGLPVYDLLEVYRDKFIHNRGKQGEWGEKIYPEQAYKREHRRLFGLSHFDYVIDFSGYSLYWAKYLVAANAKRKICFMHNDLLSDSERKVNGKRPHRINLRGLFSIYDRFDKLVSVSKGTMELNRSNLSQYADIDKFDYVMNSINPGKILQLEESLPDEAIEAMKVENYKARAVIKNAEKNPVWRILPGSMAASTYYLGKEFNKTEVIVSKKAENEERIFYKISHNNQVLGWIESSAAAILPDAIVYEQPMNKIAKIIKPKGNHIWTKPYKVEGVRKVSGSADYKNVLVEVDREAKTLHGTYYRILINDEVIGWIDQSALYIYENCTIHDAMSSVEKMKAKSMRKVIKSRNYKTKQAFIDQIGNRTLREINIPRRLYAKISYSEEFIWSKAYPNVNARKICSAADFEGAVARIDRVHRTKEGRFFSFYIGDEKIGWLQAKAFRMLKEPVVIAEREVARLAEIQLKDGKAIWTKPPGLEGAERVLRFDEMFNGSLVRVNKEVVTQTGAFCFVTRNGMPVGWIDQECLITKRVLGFEVGKQFIPEPSQENINFVNMGRLSPEKGQDNLIHAFAAFHSQYKNSKLYILGDGPLKNKLQSLINKLEISDSVHLLGQLENPFGFMKKCDCFVLSSHYEGQPMVLLEAMTLGMDIIATDIVANRTVLEDGKYGLLVENSIEGIEEGFYTVLNEKRSSFEKFDYNQYNSQAMNSFYKCLS